MHSSLPAPVLSPMSTRPTLATTNADGDINNEFGDTSFLESFDVNAVGAQQLKERDQPLHPTSPYALPSQMAIAP